jgi:hypothetical protein
VRPVRGTLSRWRWPVAALATALAGYAWWASGVTPFTGLASLAVGMPVAAVSVAAAADLGRRRATAPPRARGAGAGSRLPWIVLGVLGAGLELTALALGGRSHRVPTLSTVVDHALGTHPFRFVLFCGWLAVAVVPLARSTIGRAGDHAPGPDPAD